MIILIESILIRMVLITEKYNFIISANQIIKIPMPKRNGLN